MPRADSSLHRLFQKCEKLGDFQCEAGKDIAAGQFASCARGRSQAEPEWSHSTLAFPTLTRLTGKLTATGDSCACASIRLWIAAALATAVGLGIEQLLPPLHPILRALLVLAPFGFTYLAATRALGVAEASEVLRRVRRLLRR